MTVLQKIFSLVFTLVFFGWSQNLLGFRYRGNLRSKAAPKALVASVLLTSQIRGKSEVGIATFD